MLDLELNSESLTKTGDSGRSGITGNEVLSVSLSAEPLSEPEDGEWTELDCETRFV